MSHDNPQVYRDVGETLLSDVDFDVVLMNDDEKQTVSGSILTHESLMELGKLSHLAQCHSVY